MEQIEDIRIVLRFSSEYKIPADLVAIIIKCVDEAMKESEEADFNAITREVPQIPSEILQSIEQDFANNKFKGMYLESAENGSIIVEGIVVAAASWVLLNTIGESFKDAWKESELHQKIKDVLLSKQETKVDELIQRIKAQLDEAIAAEAEGVRYLFGQSKVDQQHRIILNTEFTHTSYGTRGDLTFKGDDDQEAPRYMAVGG